MKLRVLELRLGARLPALQAFSSVRIPAEHGNKYFQQTSYRRAVARVPLDIAAAGRLTQALDGEECPLPYEKSDTVISGSSRSSSESGGGSGIGAGF